MSSVITLEGLPPTDAGKTESRCEMVRIFSPTLNQHVDVCKDDAQRIVGTAPVVKKKRGRPKGTTVKKGAKRPRVDRCKNPQWTNHGKRNFCRCADKKNTQLLPYTSCGRKKKKGES